MASGSFRHRRAAPAHRHEGPNLAEGFLRSASRYPDRPALEAAGETLTYAGLRDRAATVATALDHHAPAGGPLLTGLFAYRTPSAFAGLLGTLLAGHGYVPLNPTFPVARTRQMLEQAGCRSLVADHVAAAQLGDVLSGMREPLLIILPDQEDVSDLVDRWRPHVVLGSADLDHASGTARPAKATGPLAYLLFTSGSTGVPKGVGVSHQNVVPFVEGMARRYGIGAQDRFSQNSDLTFDASVFDMFVAWERGACVCCPSMTKLLKPAPFIREAQLTVWKSVPSIPLMMKRLGHLRPGSLPTLRWSLFGGEPLPVGVARMWRQAAPNSRIESTYGPTEVTVSCAAYEWDPSGFTESDGGNVPLGFPLDGITAMVVDERLGEVPPGADGELLMGGPQVTAGYWLDPARTASAFVVPPGKETVFFRTGDRVRRSDDDGGPLVFLGRVDHQVKIRGYRVELGEVEAVLRDVSGADLAVAVPWPETEVGANGIEAFLSRPVEDPDAIRDRASRRLPEYMVPRRIHLVDALPVNASGKTDRPALRRLLREMSP